MSRAMDAGSIGIGAGGPWRGYFHESELPLTSLVFLLPLIIIYEVGRNTSPHPLNMAIRSRSLPS